MAEGWLRYYSGDAAEIYSAGIESHGLNPYAVKVMMDAVIDISGHRSKKVDDLPVMDFDYIITVLNFYFNMYLIKFNNQIHIIFYSKV